MKLIFATPKKRAVWIDITPSQIQYDIRSILAERMFHTRNYGHICPLNRRGEPATKNGFPVRIVARERTLDALVEAVMQDENRRISK